MSGCVFGSRACSPGTRRFLLHVVIVEMCGWQHLAGPGKFASARRRP